MFEYQTSARVQYGETDQMGFLYHGNYARYYELGRVESLRSLGLTYKRMEEELGVLMPVLTMNMRFVRPAHYDELLMVKTTLRKLPQQFITFHMEIFNENTELINGATVKLGFLEATGKTSIPCPEFLLECLRPFFVESE
ncbi:MAG: thioesterase family protein [Bacteroidota bacterium]